MKKPTASKKRTAKAAVDDWDDSAPIVPLSEQIGLSFAPTTAPDADLELLAYEGEEMLKRPSLGSSSSKSKPIDMGTGKRQVGLAPEITLEGPRYKAQKTSRKALQEEEIQAQQSDENDDNEDVNESESSQSEGDDIAQYLYDDDGANDEDDEDDDDNVEESSQEDAGTNRRRGRDEDDVGDEMLEESDEKEEDVNAVMNKMREVANTELQKAQCVATQRKVWQRILALRIKMQGLVADAAKLPRPEDADSFALEKTSEEIRSVELALMRDLAEARSALLKLHPDFAEVGVPALPDSSADSSDAWWQWVKQSNAASVNAEEKLVEDWNKRTDAQMGRQMRVVGRPIIEQVRYALRNDMPKLVKRTRVNRTGVQPMGAKTPSATDAQGKACEDNVFDDGDFYGHLLKSFLDETVGSTNAVGVLRNARRADKGKFAKKPKWEPKMEVHEKLQNFMAPLASATLPPMAEALFASLFGQIPTGKSQLDEEQEQQQQQQEGNEMNGGSDEDDNGGVKIF